MRRALTCLCWVSLAYADAACFARLLAWPMTPAALGELLAAHLVVTTIAAALATLSAPPLAAPRPVALAALAGTLALFLPVVGLIGVGAIAALGLGALTVKPTEPWMQLGPDRDLRAAAAARASRILHRRDASAASIGAALRDHSPGNADRRFLALLRVRHLPDRTALGLLKQALKDPVDEVRLFAFTRIERWRDGLERDYRSFVAALETCGRPERGVAHMRAAEACWEMAYLGLAEGAAREDALQRVLEHTENAAAFRGEDGPADFLRGRALLALGRYEEASRAFAVAARSGYPLAKVLPYAAESAFCSREFDKVRASVRELEAGARGNAAMQPIVGFWR
jgi:hypothetical protein